MKRKIFTLFLSLAILMTFMPTMAFAEEEFQITDSTGTQVASGDNTWIDGSGTITIKKNSLTITGSINRPIIIGEGVSNFTINNLKGWSISAESSDLTLNVVGANDLSLNPEELSAGIKVGGELAINGKADNSNKPATLVINAVGGAVKAAAISTGSLVINGDIDLVCYGQLREHKWKEDQLPVVGAIEIMGKNTPKIPDGYYVCGNIEYNCEPNSISEPTEFNNSGAVGYYQVGETPAEAIRISTTPPRNNSIPLKKLLVIGGITVAAVAAVAAIASSTGILSPQSMAQQKAIQQAKMQQQMVQKQVASIKTVLKGAGVVLSLASFGSSLSNLFKLNQFGFNPFGFR